jgi:hypothetical protein
MNIRSSSNQDPRETMSTTRALAVATIALAGCAADVPVNVHHPVSVVRANAFTSSTQDHVVIARAHDDSIVVAWDSRRQQDGQYGVYARRLSHDAAPLTPETQINTTTASAQMRPTCAAAPDASVWIAWQSHGQDGDGWGIVARRLDPDLAHATHEIGVNQTRDGHQSGPVIAAAGNGHVLIAWSSADADGYAIAMARIFDQNAEPVTDEFPIAYTGALRQSTLTADALGHDRFVVAWTDVDDSQLSSIHAAIVTSAGAVTSGCLARDAYDQFEPCVAARQDGAFAIAWLASDDIGCAVHARAFDASLAPLGPLTSIAAPDVESPNSGVAIAHRDRDTWLVAFNAGADDVRAADADLVAGASNAPRALFGDVAKARRLDSAGGTRRLIARDADIALAFHGDAGLGDDSGAHVALMGPRVRALTWAPQGESTSLADAVAEPHVPPTFDPDFIPQQREPLLGGDGPDFGFLGITNTGWTPPDPEMAVGKNHITAMTNGNISFFDKQGNLLFTDQIEGAGGFWGPQGAGGFVFDPETLYDPFHDRYWAMACERTGGQSYFLVAVSDDDNPVGAWHKYRINVTPIPGIFDDIDSPNFAVDQTHVYLTADFFTPSDRFLFYMVDKAPLLAGNAAPVGTNIVHTGAQSFGIPQHDDASAPRQYVIESTEFQVNTVVRLHAINDPAGAPTLTTFTLDVPDYRYPGTPPQKGGGNPPFLFEPRFWSTQYANGSLWAVHHIRRTDADNTVVRWYQITMNGWPVSGDDPALAQWGEIDAGPSTHTYFPSISANADADAAITFSRSSTTEYISVWRALRRADDPPGAFQEMVLVKESTAPHNSGRWGDYSQTRFDPAQPCAFWGHNEWTNNALSWNTWIAQYLNTHIADVNQDCQLDILDFIAFQSLFVAGDLAADFNDDGILDILDFVAYQNAFQS